MLNPFKGLAEEDRRPGPEGSANLSRLTPRAAVLPRVLPPRQISKAPAPTPEKKIGLFILHDRETAAADIVAVHGLCGDPFDTWTEETSEKLWLRDFLPDQVPNTRIMSYGYDSIVAFSKTEIELADTAADLLNRLNDGRTTSEEKNRPVIFICHSLGGIVVKKALILAQERPGAYGGLLEMAKGAIFMGTPHRGADAASWANFAAQLLKALRMGATNTSLVSDLTQNSATLRRISQQFERGSTLLMKTFYETIKLGYMSCLVVENDSAILNLPTELPAVPISANHRSICQFASKYEQKYEPVWRAVKYFVETLCPVTVQTLRSIVETVDSVQLLRQILAVDQEDHKSHTHPSSCDRPEFYWIFKNMDFEHWQSTNGSEVLWLSGPAERRISDASSCIVDLVKDKPSKAQHMPVVLYFFCSTAPAEASIAITFVSTITHQLIRSLPLLKEGVTSTFLHTLLDTIIRGEPLSHPEQSRFKGGDSANTTVKKILKASSTGYWRALRAVTDIVREQELSFIIDGLDEVGHQQREFVLEIRAFIEHLRGRSSTTRVLLTSRPQAEIKEILSELPCIEYDKERKECLNCLRFGNTRYEKISDEYKGSLQWLWTKQEYLAWSSAGTSDLLLIEGRPGSGKSTLMKYVQRSLMQQEPRGGQIVASFYYSHREEEQQTIHSNMLRSVLHDILKQDEAFFFHFQRSHRENGDLPWSYRSLKEILLSLAEHHPLEKRIYLIVDAVDEYVDGDRYDVIKLLHGICATKGPCIVKAFVASRPIIGLDRHSAEKDRVIRLEDVNSSDILNYAESFLLGLELPSDIIGEAREYIVQHAQGVFVWVHLVKEELRRYSLGGATGDQIFSYLKSLPTDLEGFYERILTELEGRKREGIEDGFGMLQFVLFAYRPLRLEELRQALAVSGDPGAEFSYSNSSFQRNLIRGIDNRLTSRAGNFLETKNVHGDSIVQVMHQTVREFFRPNGPTAQSPFRMNANGGHIRISTTCIRYIMLCVADASSIDQQAGKNSWGPENFEACAQYLSQRPFFNYALGFAKLHLQEGGQVARDSELVSQLCEKLNESPAAGYLLGDWIPQDWGKRIATDEELSYGKRFRAELLHTAIHMRYSQVVEALLIAGADVEACLGGKTPLMVAAESGDLVTARVLLDRGALIGARDTNKQTALHLAAANGHNPVVGLLVDRGADKEAPDKKEQRALHLAAASGHEPVASLLVGWGADKEAKDRNGQTALHLAAASGHKPVVSLLMDQDTNMEAEDMEEQTALHFATAGGYNPAEEVPIDRGVDKEANISKGQTAMHLAATSGHEAAVQILVDASASTEVRDNSSRATHPRAETGISKSDLLLTPGGPQASSEAREQAVDSVAPSISGGESGESGGEADMPDSDADTSGSGSVVSAIGSVFSSLASQSTATSISQVPPEAMEQAEGAIASVLVKNHSVSIIVVKGVDKLGQKGVEWLMAKALWQFSSAIKLSLGKDKPLLRDSFRFIEHRARSIARKIRELAQSNFLAVPEKAALKKYLEDMHSHKVPSSERVRPWQVSRPDTSDEPLTFHEPEHIDGEELGKLNEEGEGEGLGESSEIKRFHELDKPEEPLMLHGPEYKDGEEPRELNEEGEDKGLGESSEIKRFHEPGNPEEPLRLYGPKYRGGEELGKSNEKGEDEGLAESSEIKRFHEPDKPEEPLTLHRPEYIGGEELDELNEEGEDEELGENLLRQITEYLASDKVSSDFLCAVKENFLKVNDGQGRVDDGSLAAEPSRPELENESRGSHQPSVGEGSSVAERIRPGLGSEGEEPHGPSVGGGALPAQQSGPEPEEEGEEPHHHFSVADRSLEQDSIKATEGNNARVADSTIQTFELVKPVIGAPQVCTDKWPAFFADGKTDIRFDDRNPWSFSNGIKGLIENWIGVRVNWWPLSARREAIPDGFSRVAWKCRCGRSLSGIISTTRRVRYEQWLSTHNGERPAQSAGLPPVDQEGDFRLAAASGSPNGTTLVPLSSIPPSSHQNPSWTGGAGQGSSSSGRDSTTSDRYLLWCVTSGLGPTRQSPTVVRPIRVEIGDRDEQAFNKLREVFHQTRGFWRIVSLHEISEIRYVRFRKLSRDRVACFPDQELPGPSEQEYEYCLPDNGHEPPDIPPIPVEELMEYFHKPSCAGTGNEAIESFPKKRSDAITRTGWGLHACELLSFFRILLVLGLFLVGTLVFVPYWLWRHPGDLQNAFIPPAVFIAFAGVCIAAAALCTPRQDPGVRR